MTSFKFGYVRVSAQDQNPDSQAAQMDVDKIIIEKASGKERSRPQLDMLLSQIRPGDTIIVNRINRLARNMDHLREIVKEITSKKASIVFQKENLTFDGNDTPVSNFMLSILGAFGQFETEVHDERKQEGIEHAKKLGKYRGRKPCLTFDQLEEIKEDLRIGLRKARIARDHNISIQTLDNYLKGKSTPHNGKSWKIKRI